MLIYNYNCSDAVNYLWTKYIHKVAGREVWFTPLQALCRSEHSFATVGSLSICIPCAVDSSCASTFPSPSQQESAFLWHWAFWLQPPRTTHGFVLGEHWARSGGGLHHVTQTRLLSVPCLRSTGRKGSYCQVSWRLQKKKSFLAEGWKRLAGLSGPGSSYYKWPYTYILHVSFHYLVKFHLSRSCYWQKFF